MNRTDFVTETVIRLDEKLFVELKNKLIEDAHINWEILPYEEITKLCFAEKIYDYIEKVELSKGKTFDKVIERYMNDIDSLVRDRIAKATKSGKKNEGVESIPRARKYYDKAALYKKKKCLEIQDVMDYSRIVLCLYMTIIDNHFLDIYDFEYSLKNLRIDDLMNAMKNEKNSITKKPKFDFSDDFDSDKCTYVLILIMYYYIISMNVEGI